MSNTSVETISTGADKAKLVASAVLAASIFHFGEATIGDAHRALALAGLAVRHPVTAPA